MNTNISCLYESVILEQQVNYFILENKYILLNEANSKGILSKIKNFIVEKIRGFIRIIGKFIGIIRNFLSKFFPFLKKKNNDAKSKCKDINKVMINTVDVKKAEKWINDIQDIIISKQYDARNLDVTLGYLNNKNDTFAFKKEDLDKSKEYLKDTIEMFKENKEKISKIGDGEIVTVNQPLSTITDFYNKFEPEVKKFQDNLQKQEKYMNEVLKKCESITIDGVDDESQRQTMMNLSIEYFTSENSCITTGYNKIINIIQTMNPTKVLNAVEKYPDVAGKYNVIEQALINSNIDGLREYVGSIFYNSRDNSNGEIDAMLGYIEARGVKIKDDKLNGKLISDGKDTYTDEDFTKAVYKLKENFCDERINDVKKIGKALYGKKEKQSKNNKGSGYDLIDKAIQKNDITLLRTGIANLIYADMGFEGNEFDRVVKYVESTGIKFKDSTLKGKLISDGKTSFTDNDFSSAVYELKENFCDERINDVKKIGKALYGKKEASQKKQWITYLPQSYEYFDKLIVNNQIDELKIAVVNTVYGDMSFSDGEFDKVIKYIESKGIKLKDSKLKGDLISTSKSSYVNDDFADAVYELRNNFCDERINDVKKIGKALYGKNK